MTCAVISRAWRGETPYVRSWCDYYLNHLGFDRIILIRCDEERFDFLSDFGDRIEFKDRKVNDSDSASNAISDAEVPKGFDWVFSCDLDEFLVLHGRTVAEFLEGSHADCHFFWWALCCSTVPSGALLNDNLSLGASRAHDGKSLFRTSAAEGFRNEHRIRMKNLTETLFHHNDFLDSPYILHMCSRSLEDLVIRGVWQKIKIEPARRKYLFHLDTPPKKFMDLPLRFRIAYLQTRMNKVPFRCDLPELAVDKEKLSEIFYQTGATLDTDLFRLHYEVKEMLEGYPESLYGLEQDFGSLVGEQNGGVLIIA